MTTVDQHVMRRYHQAARNALNPSSPPVLQTGMIVNGDQGTGTVTVSISGDPTPVPATYAYVPGWSPDQGHRVVVTWFGGQAHVLHAVAGPNGPITD